jgi:hypothetical protein
MQNISKFCAITKIKPELSNVYVHNREKDGVLVAVACDSFKIIEQVIPEKLKDILTAGYYEPKAWGTIVKLYNKKNVDFGAISEEVQKQQAIKDTHKDYQYPDYTRIIPDFDTLDTFMASGTGLYTKSYLVDFLEMIPDQKSDKVDLSVIKESSKMLAYKDNTIMMLLMKRAE